MRRIHHCWPIAALVAIACGGVGTPSAVAAEPIAACAPALAATAVPAGVPILDWSENVGYDAQGNLWVSRLYRNEVQRYDSSGALTARVPVEYPGAVRLGPDGLLYVVYGDSPTSVLRPGGVVRFDPAAPDPRPETFVSGFTMPNGAAFDTAGNLYVAGASGVTRIRRDGTVDTDWTARAATAVANGIVVRGGSIYLTSNGNPLGRVLRMSIDDPAARSVVADLSSTLPGIPDFADDLVDRDGILYVTTISGQLVRIDPDTNAACTVLTGQPMTSVVAVPGRPDELLAGTEGGAILRIRLSR
ncbi:SMP-30/gluconolactonase/LRE family protein [Nocardia sp. GCM10030253]|uniref:SMP-30/gluconolactonase/LRE family protein n=1 Tax=Nocardia sp. GCM10030253 TaxID=3273404 RepID=UPI00363C7B77